MTTLMGSLHEQQYTFLLHLAQFFLEWEMLQRKLKHPFYVQNLFFPKCMLFYGYGNVLYSQRGHRWHYDVHHMLDTKSYKHTLSIRNAFCFSTGINIAHTCLNVILYAHCPSALFLGSTDLPGSYCSFVIK